MRHKNRKHKLGASGPHRSAMMGNLSVSLITHARIETTLAKARALRPFVEKIITLAKAEKSKDAASKLHLRRLAIARMRDKAAVSKLFDELVGEFTERNGGYTRIYKLGQRVGDAAEMALIELIDGSDEGYVKKSKKKTAKKAFNKTDDKGQSEASNDKPEANEGEDKSEKALKEAVLDVAEIQESETSEINKAAESADSAEAVEEDEEAPVEELKESSNKDA